MARLTKKLLEAANLHCDRQRIRKTKCDKQAQQTNLSGSEAPDNQFSGEGSSDSFLVVENGRHLDGRRQRQHLGTRDVMLAQVEYDEVRVAVERVLHMQNS